MGDTLWIWLLAGGLSLGICALLLSGLLLRRNAPEEAAGAADLQVYRDQLKEVARDQERGVIEAVEAKRLETEIARRLLAADRAAQAAKAAGPGSGTAIVVVAVLAAAGAALALYARLGQPGYPDMPIAARLAGADSAMADRPDQAEVVARLPAPMAPEIEPEYAELLAKLRAAVDPATATDLDGLALLARNEANVNNLPAAIAAQSRLIVAKGGDVSAEDHADLADLLIQQAQGYVSPEAEAALIRALTIDPQNGLARYYSGLMFAQGGRFDRAFAIWRPLLELPPDPAPWDAALRQQIPQVAELAGVNYQPPGPALRGPSAEDIANAATLSDDERAAMIEGMIASLQDRLATTGGPVEEWARLISSLGMVGRKEEASAILTEAKLMFSGRPGAAEILQTAAENAGIAP